MPLIMVLRAGTHIEDTTLGAGRTRPSDRVNLNHIFDSLHLLASVCWRTDHQSSALYSGSSRSSDTPLDTRSATSFLCRLFWPGAARRMQTATSKRMSAIIVQTLKGIMVPVLIGGVALLETTIPAERSSTRPGPGGHLVASAESGRY